MPDKMRITFLGTGTSQGVPVIACRCPVCMSDDSDDKRLRCSVLIEHKGETIVIDTGPDFRQQMLRHDVRRLSAILFTHQHKDHVAGMDDIRAFNYIMRKKIDVFATPMVQQALKREYSYVFEEEKYPGIPEVTLHDIDSDPFSVGDVRILPVKVWHMNMPVLAFRINDFAYITDANRIDAEEMEKLNGCRILVINALRKTKHLSHFSLDEALEYIARLKPERAYITHISHLMGKHRDVQKELPDNVFLSSDSLVLEC